MWRDVICFSSIVYSLMVYSPVSTYPWNTPEEKMVLSIKIRNDKLHEFFVRRDTFCIIVKFNWWIMYKPVRSHYSISLKLNSWKKNNTTLLTCRSNVYILDLYAISHLTRRFIILSMEYHIMSMCILLSFD